MPIPNANSAPQPEDGIILRGAIQMETALLALQATGINPDLQNYLGESLESTKQEARRAEQTDTPMNHTWFMLGSKEAKTAKKDILASLALAAAEEDTDQQLARAAQSLIDILGR